LSSRPTGSHNTVLLVTVSGVLIKGRAQRKLSVSALALPFGALAPLSIGSGCGCRAGTILAPATESF
jgi:hypothetical protein